MPQWLPLVIFALVMAAFLVCGCILTRKLRKKLPTQTVGPAVSDERQAGCFALEEEKGDHWTGSGVPSIKEARPTL